MIFRSRRMRPPPFLQKQLVSIIDTLVKGIVEEVCGLNDVSALKPQHEARAPGDDSGVETDLKVRTVTAALEKLTKQAAEQIGQLFYRVSDGARARAPLSYTQRQKLKRKPLEVDYQTAKGSSVKSSCTGAQSAAGDTAHQERGLDEKDLPSQAESVSGGTDLLYTSDDTTVDKSEGLFSQAVEAALAQQNPVLKVELDHKKANVNCSVHQEQKDETVFDQQDSAVKAISEEGNDALLNCVLPNSSDTLEIKVSAAQSLEFNAGAKANGGSYEQEMPVRAGKTSGSARKGTTARKLIRCEACGKTFTYLNNLKRHQKTFHSRETPHACQDCGEGFCSRRLLRVHRREHRVEKPHACALCGKVFRLPNHLKKHMVTHTNERPFACATCGKNFALVSTLKAHERTHSGEKTFACMRCGMSFLTKSYLDYHQRVHTGEKPHTCVHCGKTFAQRSNLRVHERLHTGEKPFRCDDCGESFIHANSYKSHKQLHTGVKAFCCEHCGKGFRRGTHLKTHLLTHSGVKPFQCDLCPKTFALKGSLKAHRLTHTGEKSFACNVCSKRFTQASSLGKHKRTHTGEKPYRCSFCKKSFCQSSHLHYHYRASHPGAAGLAEAMDITSYQVYAACD